MGAEPEVGLEPTTCGLRNRCSGSARTGSGAVRTRSRARRCSGVRAASAVLIRGSGVSSIPTGSLFAGRTALLARSCSPAARGAAHLNSTPRRADLDSMEQPQSEARRARMIGDGVYRYDLWRGGTRSILWIMLNPSTADHIDDDPTMVLGNRSELSAADG